MISVHIKGWPEPAIIQHGTILDAALSQNVPVPFQCRAGECGRCKCRLLKGVVEHDSYLPEALTNDERSSGLILACRARPTSDVEIDYEGRLDGPAPRPRRGTARVHEIEHPTGDTIRLVLEFNGPPLPFRAGQFARLRFGERPARSYSMANLPGNGHLEFFIRHLPGGKVSGHIAKEVMVGDPVDIDGPFGQCYLREEVNAPILAVAGGSGLAPMLSIARRAADLQIPHPFHFYFGVRREADLFATDALTEVAGHHPAMRVHVVVSDQIPAPEGFRAGYPHQAFADDFADLSQVIIYTAGPPPLVAAVEQTAKALGAAPDRILSDPFTAEPPRKATFVNTLISKSLGLLGRPDLFGEKQNKSS